MSAAANRRVLYVNDNLGLGGAERQLALLLKGLPAGCDARVWSLQGGAYAAVLEGMGVPTSVRARRGRLDPRPALSVWCDVARWRPDVVHSFGWMASAAVVPACRAFRIPLVDGSIRAGALPRRRMIASRLTMRFASRVIANSEAGLRAWCVDSDRGRVVHNGFDPDRLEGLPTGPGEGGLFVVVMTGRMVPGKDYRTFVEAARELAEGPGCVWRFLAVGDGPERRGVVEEAGALVEQGTVSFVSAESEVMPRIATAHVGVLLNDPTFHAEGCSNAIMEYMACGLPVICTDAGGNRELVVDGETGFLIPGGDRSALVDRLRRLRDDPETAARLGAAGQERIMREFTVRRMVQGVLDVYEEVLR